MANSLKGIIMKKTIFTYLMGILLLLINSIALAQIVYIPDQNFKNKLIQLGIDTNGDGEISYTEASAFYGTLYLNNSEISDLTGIEAFYHLSALFADWNNIDSLNLWNIPLMSNFSCSHNNLTHIVFGINMWNLQSLNIAYNYLTEINVGNLSGLHFLECDYNNLVHIDFNSELNYIHCSNNNLTEVPFTPGSDLTSIVCSYNQIDSVDLSIFDQLINFYCDHNNLSYFVGPSHEMNFLDCSYNNLISLDLSNCDNYDGGINFSNNQITEFIPPINHNINSLNLENNLLETLDLGGICNLKYLNVSNNLLNTFYWENPGYQGYIGTLDLSNNLLETFYLDSISFIKTLNLSNNFFTTIPNLVVQSIRVMNISNNSFHVIDLNNIDDLDTLICQSNQIEELDVSSFRNIKLVDISNCNNLNLFCVNYLPLLFDIIDEGVPEYKQIICHPYPGNLFMTGQIENTIYYNPNLNPLNMLNYDLNGDVYFDIHIFKTIVYEYPCTYTNWYVEPLNSFKISPDYFTENEIIFPNDLIWKDTSLWVAYREQCNGYPTWENNASGYISVKHNIGADTIYSWIVLGEIDDFLTSTASWSPCTKNIDLGNDTAVFIGDSLILDAGEGFDSYYWNTGDTTEFKNVFTNDLGTGTWQFRVYANAGSCYYADTINILVISQTCLPEGITFSSQEDIDNFQTNYPGCSEIEGNVTISGSNLTSLNGLSVVTSIGGGLSINNNEVLFSLSGLENIDPNSISQLEIYNNDLLSLCNIENICTYLTDPDATVNIHDNATGCNSAVELRDSCNIQSVKTILDKEKLIIILNPGNYSVTLITSDGEKIEQLTIYNQIGQMVTHEKPCNSAVNLNKLYQGIYILEVSTKSWIARKKLMIK